MAAGEHEFTPTGKIKRPDVEQLCEWKCGISKQLDGMEDETVYAHLYLRKNLNNS
jgi:hypothetical protein